MKHRWWRSGLAVWLAALLLAPTYALPAAQVRFLGPREKEPGLTIPETDLNEEQKIIHLLNRIGFGPRPKDIERVKQMGIAAYIEQQLHPETIPDPEMGQRLAGFETLEMTPFELLATYPPPQILRVIEQRLAPQMGMDPEAAGVMFPELERYRTRQDPSASSGQ
ncbi:DUF1800 domain-containing protein, partial [Acidobacteriia bacterium AH_259_A11_L15]|nr:DUF1800 domain-containing protein [Acidobacteriia bacterium AH_259_A11_L15]